MTADEIVIRPLQTQNDFAQCVALQHEIWGADFGEAAPPSILLATQKVGGVAAGAFDSRGRLVGFIFGINGIREGRLAHWSDMLGVREGLRDRGLGRRLKAHQREHLLNLGIGYCYWSYDPLEARNAHVNMNHLGAQPIEYVPDMYGDAPHSPMLAGLSTDRFIVEWNLKAPGVQAALEGRPVVETANAAEAPIVSVGAVSEEGDHLERALPTAPVVRVEIPADIQNLKREAHQVALTWRAATRRAFTHYMGRRYRVTKFQRELALDRCFYVLAAPSSRDA